MLYIVNKVFNSRLILRRRFIYCSLSAAGKRKRGGISVKTGMRGYKYFLQPSIVLEIALKNDELFFEFYQQRLI